MNWKYGATLVLGVALGWAAGVVRTADVLGERMGAVDAHVIEARSAALRCAYLCTEPLDAGFRHP